MKSLGTPGNVKIRAIFVSRGNEGLFSPEKDFVLLLNPVSLLCASGLMRPSFPCFNCRSA